MLSFGTSLGGRRLVKRSRQFFDDIGHGVILLGHRTTSPSAFTVGSNRFGGVMSGSRVSLMNRIDGPGLIAPPQFSTDLSHGLRCVMLPSQLVCPDIGCCKRQAPARAR